MGIDIEPGPKRPLDVLLVVATGALEFGRDLQCALASRNDPTTLFDEAERTLANAIDVADIVVLVARREESSGGLLFLEAVARAASERGRLLWANVHDVEQKGLLVEIADNVEVRSVREGDIARSIHLMLIRRDVWSDALSRRALAAAVATWNDRGRPDDLLLTKTSYRSGGPVKGAFLRDYVDASRKLIELTDPTFLKLPDGHVRYSLVGKASKPTSPVEPSARRRSPRARADDVDCSVFAPDKAAPCSQILVQILLHPLGAIAEARDRALTIDDTASLRGSSTLEIPIPARTRVTVSLAAEGTGIAIDRPVQSAIWLGQLTSISFVVTTPSAEKVIFPTVRVACDDALVAEIRFKLEVVASPDAIPEERPSKPQTGGRRYERVFFSYSSEDRARVLEVAQSYKALGVAFFQDILSLEPGQRWEQGLYREIDDCDLLLLFWSLASSRSKWVEKEVRYALDKQKSRGGRTPDIVPFILEGPPAPKPPDFLSHLHFDDWMRYAIEALGASPPKKQVAWFRFWQ